MLWVKVIVVVVFGQFLFFMAGYQLRLDKKTKATLKRTAKIKQRTDRMRKRQEN